MKLKTLAPALACAALFCATPARAQQGQALVRVLLDSATTLVENQDYEEARAPVFGRLEEDQDEEFQLRVRAGHTYVFVGVCDENCSDLDIVVTDEDGDELESDVELDDTPMVVLEAEETTTITVTVSMATCRDH
ncbi:hypothetical protein, partial [Longimicrobium sp.]|uniref:hypothetical protein n=1 Tax=Longimicrobium sp. TaxID=2029185 RepID=UPI002F93294F